MLKTLAIKKILKLHERQITNTRFCRICLRNKIFLPAIKDTFWGPYVCYYFFKNKTQYKEASSKAPINFMFTPGISVFPQNTCHF